LPLCIIFYILELVFIRIEDMQMNSDTASFVSETDQTSIETVEDSIVPNPERVEIERGIQIRMFFFIRKFLSVFIYIILILSYAFL
jgi:hypothetical protein